MPSIQENSVQKCVQQQQQWDVCLDISWMYGCGVLQSTWNPRIVGIVVAASTVVRRVGTKEMGAAAGILKISIS
eukprot:CAMPEP_0172392188 /NCGR_PEP_ID=MMETSP1061-20121228/8390_1 /TAXON_ID=37318 /ORGANISM="Pseudo-nitzschia pungens, Strain cf. pungens" /LENGTH=73 /DNA_ID=CAMNT_0013122979 /DNA_START=1 /DNA_END=219 /DNA_ORIENTATION=-